MQPTYVQRSSRCSMVKKTIAGVAGISAIAGVSAGGIILSQQNQSNAAHAAGVALNVDSSTTCTTTFQSYKLFI